MLLGMFLRCGMKCVVCYKCSSVLDVREIRILVLDSSRLSASIPPIFTPKDALGTIFGPINLFGNMWISFFFYHIGSFGPYVRLPRDFRRKFRLWSAPKMPWGRSGGPLEIPLGEPVSRNRKTVFYYVFYMEKIEKLCFITFFGCFLGFSLFFICFLEFSTVMGGSDITRETCDLLSFLLSLNVHKVHYKSGPQVARNL